VAFDHEDRHTAGGQIRRTVLSGRASIARTRSQLSMVHASVGINPNGEWRTTTDSPGSDAAAVHPSARMNVEASAITSVQVVSPLTMADGVGW